jgi:hypothetical protein
MHVGDEARPSQGPGSKPMQRPNIESLEHRIHSNALAASQAMGETYGLAVDENEVYLGVRHPESFDDVLDRGRAVKSMSETAFAPCNGQVVVELFVKAKLHRGHGSWDSGTGVAYAVHACFNR